MRLIFDELEKIICAVLLLGMTALGFANVIVRYGTHRSFAATEELLTGGFVLLTVFGAAIAARRGEHLAVQLFTELLPPAGRRIAIWFARAASVLLLSLSVWVTVDLVRVQLGNGMRSYGLGLPLWWYSVGVPLGLALVLLRYVQAFSAAETKDVPIV